MKPWGKKDWIAIAAIACIAFLVNMIEDAEAERDERIPLELRDRDRA